MFINIKEPESSFEEIRLMWVLNNPSFWVMTNCKKTILWPRSEDGYWRLVDQSESHKMQLKPSIWLRL